MLLLALLACADKVVDSATAELLDVYPIASEDMFPEGVAYHPGERAFFVSSLTTGGLYRVNADGSEATVFTPEPGWMSLGMKIEPDTDTLVMCGVYNYGEADTTGAIWAFDPASGERTADVNLGAAFDGASCNDVAFHGGFVYVTDRENPNLYRVDLGAGTVELWLTDPALEPGLIGQNGVVVTDDDALLVGKYGPAELLRIPIDDPSSLQGVTLTGDAVAGLPDGFDGIVRLDDQLIIAGNRQTLQLSSSDGWTSAAVITHNPGTSYAAVTVAEGQVYGLKGEVVNFVLGLDVDLPFEIRAIDGL